MQENPSGGRSHLVSLGEGVEREVLYSAFAGFLAESSQWLQPRVDGSYTIATTLPARAARFLSKKRMQNLQVFGALTSLLVINQICPSPLSPLFLHFLIHGSQLQSLHKLLVTEWHPELASTIQQWINLGHAGNPQPFESHFASYHDTQVHFFKVFICLIYIDIFIRLHVFRIALKKGMMHLLQKCFIVRLLDLKLQIILRSRPFTKALDFHAKMAFALSM